MKKIIIVFQILTLLAMSSCSGKTETVEQYENDLNGALISNFDYYFSMELWSLAQIAAEASSVSSNSDEQCCYLKGKIDTALEYSSYYCYVTERFQTNLSKQIISDNFKSAFYEFGEAKVDYLNKVSLDLENNRSLIESEEFKENSNKLASALDNMNVDVTSYDEDEMNEYISKMNEATELMKTLSLKQIPNVEKQKYVR